MHLVHVALDLCKYHDQNKSQNSWISSMLWTTDTPRIRCVLVSDTRWCSILTLHWHIWLQWVISFPQSIIIVSVLVYVSCPVFVFVLMLYRFYVICMLLIPIYLPVCPFIFQYISLYTFNLALQVETIAKFSWYIIKTTILEATNIHHI